MFSNIKHLNKKDIIKNGSIFTPQHLVELTLDLCKLNIDKDTYILDMGAGYGAFIDIFKTYGKCCIGTDIDEKSICLLKETFPEITFYKENSLININRAKYNLSEKDKLLIIGNPPYNDITSKYKKGQKGIICCDNDIVSRDLGISFLKAYCKLNADYICVLHPLAYLIKKTNFNSLKQFKDNYKLQSATIFSSKNFSTINKSNSDFPVVAAFYKRDKNGMDYEYIRNFTFSIYKSLTSFCLKNITTIDGIISKYPQKNSAAKIQFYTLRDINALMRNKSFVKGSIVNGIDVTINNLYQYAWLLFFKENFAPITNSFIYGNLSPLYSQNIEKADIKNMLVSYAYYKNQIVHNSYDLTELEKVYGKIKQQNFFPALIEIINNCYL